MLPAGGRLAGLDLGTKTIGVALCDALWTFASPLTVLTRAKLAKNKGELTDIIMKQSAKGLVLGLPLSMDGSDSPRTQSTRAFARNVVDLGLPILLWDERWSTQAVERAMIEQDLSRAKRASRVDAHAAAHILQGAIDALAAAG